MVDSDASEKRPHLEVNALVAAVALLCVTPAESVRAQVQDQGATSPVFEEVTVTGSRIVRSGMQTATPVTVITNEEMNQLAPGLDMVDALSELPQFLNNTVTTHAFNSSIA